jgi:DNA relaxase NicK
MNSQVNVNAPMIEALKDIIENIQYHSIRQSKENQQRYFFESCYAYGFSDKDTQILWESCHSKLIFEGL